MIEALKNIGEVLDGIALGLVIVAGMIGVILSTAAGISDWRRQKRLQDCLDGNHLAPEAEGDRRAS
jgi:hypothetical protein